MLAHVVSYRVVLWSDDDTEHTTTILAWLRTACLGIGESRSGAS